MERARRLKSKAPLLNKKKMVDIRSATTAQTSEKIDIPTEPTISTRATTSSPATTSTPATTSEQRIGIFDLPPEIRDEIWTLLVHTPKRIFFNIRRRVRTWRYIPLTFFDLRNVNRQVCQEAEKVFFRTNTFDMVLLLTDKHTKASWKKGFKDILPRIHHITLQYLPLRDSPCFKIKLDKVKKEHGERGYSVETTWSKEFRSEDMEEKGLSFERKFVPLLESVLVGESSLTWRLAETIEGVAKECARQVRKAKE